MCFLHKCSREAILNCQSLPTSIDALAYQNGIIGWSSLKHEVPFKYIEVNYQKKLQSAQLQFERLALDFKPFTMRGGFVNWTIIERECLLHRPVLCNITS